MAAIKIFGCLHLSLLGLTLLVLFYSHNMVGFGSSLRMASRSGWENAYFDYETLKLLLSQIESVYEEEWHRQRTNTFAMGGSDTDTSPPSRIKAQRKRGVTDYRDELFLESDSDVAFASSVSDVIPDELLSSDDDERRSNQNHARNDSGTTGTAKPFTLTYSQEASSSDFDDSSVDLEATCATALGWSRYKTSAVTTTPPTKKSKKKYKRRILETPGGDSEFYVGHNNSNNMSGPSSFLLEQSGGDTATNTAFGQSIARPTERSSLLQSPQSSQFFSFQTRDASVTPPRDFSGAAQYPQLSSMGVTPHQPQASAVRPRPTAAEMRREKFEHERKRKRRQRRRRRFLKKRQELERRVPRHLRNAHQKARSITERFLGLLRAEVEKVTLFAQSRLGELADTAGSLRFPSYEDSEYGSFSSSHGRRRGGTAAYDHPLSDGGMHPSASSSEDEGHGGRQSVLSWSDSSDEGDTSDSVAQGARSPTYGQSVEKNYSSGTIASAPTVRRANRSEPGTAIRQDSVGTKKAKKAAREAMERKIAHYTNIRRKRSIFQRNDDIVGEDLLLLSAVDEADGYTTVGVELMHVLRYICVNVIAVRKICRKHDRLLMNRMLGGYYHRRDPRQTTKKASMTMTDTNNTLTLGSIVSRSVGEDCRVDPASASAMNQNKLVGVYDQEIQELANSITVQVISSCLALALSESEVSRSRADALSKLKSVSSSLKTPRRSGKTRQGSVEKGVMSSLGLSPSQWLPRTKNEEPTIEPEMTVDSDAEGEGGPPSTDSSVSLTRLRFTVMSIFALREAAREKINIHNSFLSRSLLAFVGPNIVGEGLDGCSRAVLDFFVSYDPDSALLRDSSDVYHGLHEDDWRHGPIGSVMLSALAMGVSLPSSDFSAAGDAVLNAISIQPASTERATGNKNTLHDQVSAFLTHSKLSIVPCITINMIQANRLGSFLQTMNYFILHTTANTFVMAAEARQAHSAIIIGAASLGALLAASFHANRLSKEATRGNFLYGFYRHAMLVATLFSLLGNVVYVLAVERSSVPLAVTGRLLLGCGSTDLLHRQLTRSLPGPCVVVESARLVNAQIFGVMLALLLGAFLASFGQGEAPSGHALQSSSYLMGSLWAMQFLFVLFAFYRDPEIPKNIHGTEERSKQSTDSQDGDEFSSDDSDVSTKSDSDLPNYETKATFSAEEARIPLNYSPPGHLMRNRSIVHACKVTTSRVRKYIMSNIALPVTLALIFFATVSHEVLFTSCAIITNRYFAWNGSQAGLFLGSMSAFVFLINHVCGSIANIYDERTVVKRSVWLVGLGFVVMINYSSLFSLASQVASLLDEATSLAPVSYDWIFGVLQYLIGFSLVFTGFIAMDGASLVLMSKVAPTMARSTVINCGTIVTFTTLAARFLGDVEICMVGLSTRIINTDILNSLVVPLLLACVAAGYIVKRHFFFLL